MTRCNGGMERTRGMPDGILCLFHNIVISRSGRFVKEMVPRPSILHEPMRGRGTFIRSSNIFERLRKRFLHLPPSRSPKDHLLDREHRSVQALHL
ncbi:hypothetical protein KC323_g326 [Hortaea werneckii]|nr:hypothetical protein KC323_g326 [Hortaea werneckii]